MATKKKASKKKSSKKASAASTDSKEVAAAKSAEQESDKPTTAKSKATSPKKTSAKKASKKKTSAKKAASRKAPVKKKLQSKTGKTAKDKEENKKVEQKIVGKTILGKRQYLRLNPRNIVIVEGFNPRIDKTDTELTASIKEHGVLQPILVRRVGKHFELIDGERRLRTAIRLAQPEIPAIEKLGNQSQEELLTLALIHNEGRPLAPVEEADAYRRLIAKGWTAKRIAHQTGKSLRLVRDRLELISAHPDVAAAVKSGKLSVSMGLQIAKKARGKKVTQKALTKRATKNEEGKKQIASALGHASLKTKLEKQEVGLQNRLNKLISMINKKRKDKKEKLPVRLVDLAARFSRHKNKEVRAAYVAGGVAAISSTMGEANFKRGRGGKKKVTARGKQKKKATTRSS